MVFKITPNLATLLCELGREAKVESSSFMPVTSSQQTKGSTYSLSLMWAIISTASATRFFGGKSFFMKKYIIKKFIFQDGNINFPGFIFLFVLIFSDPTFVLEPFYFVPNGSR